MDSSSSLIISGSFCRLCLNLTSLINHATDLKSNELLCDVLKGIFPGMKLDLVETPRICKICVEKLQSAFTFKDNILCNELKLQSGRELTTKAVNVCRLCLKRSGGNVEYIHKNNNCSYSYETIRAMIEIVATQLNLNVFKNPVMCNQCWMVVKDIFAFIKICFKTEVKLRTLFETNGHVLSDRQILDMIYKENNVEHSQNANTKNVEQNIAVSSEIRGHKVKESDNKEEISEFSMKLEVEKETNNTVTEIAMFTNETNQIGTQQTEENSQSSVTISDIDSNICEIKPDDIVGLELEEEFEDIFEEKFHDGNVVEIRIRNNIGSVYCGEWTEKIEEFSSFFEDFKLDIKDEDIDNNIDIYSSANITDSATETNKHSVLESLPSQKQISGMVNAKLAIPKKQLKINVTDCIKYRLNPLRTAPVVHKEISILRVNLVDCIKHQPSQDRQKIIKNIIRNIRNTPVVHKEMSILRVNLVDCIKHKLSQDRQKIFKNIIRNIRKHNIKSHFKSSIPKVTVQTVPKKRIRCAKCNFVTSEKPLMNAHMDKHKRQSETGSKCHNCQFVSDNPDQLLRHSSSCQINQEIPEESITQNDKKNKSVRTSEKTIGDHIKSNETTQAIAKSSGGNKSIAATSTKSKEKQKQYICDTCQKGFSSSGNLHRHKRTHLSPTHSSDRTFICNICEHSFEFKSRLKEHLLAVHLSERKYICDICQKAFKARSDRDRHRKFVHAIEPIAFCDICQRGFKSPYSLERHQATHLNERNFVCDICQKAFKSRGSLRNHKLIHFQKKFICDVCPKSFCFSAALKLHKNTAHNSVRRFICDVCQKGFKTAGQRQRHSQYSHAFQPKAVCDICKKGFKYPSSLGRHQLSHLDERNFVCDICQKSFKLRECLYQHKLIHFQKKYMCDVCQKSFRHSCTLRNHKNTVHISERQFICNVCQKGFKSKVCLKVHLIVHWEARKFICDICQKSFKTLPCLKSHKLVHDGNARKKVCNICEKAFKRSSVLRQHIATHSDQRRFACKICQNTFKSNSSLYRHKQRKCYGREFMCRVCFKVCMKRSTLERHRNACGDTDVICYHCQKEFKSKSELIEHLTVHSKGK